MSDQTKYTWVITRDNVLGDTSNAVGRIGPSGAKNRMRFDIVIQRGRRFRLLNSAGRPEFSGYILGEYEGHEPLEDYGRDCGCVAIEYEHGDSWVPISASGSE